MKKILVILSAISFICCFLCIKNAIESFILNEYFLAFLCLLSVALNTYCAITYLNIFVKLVKEDAIRDVQWELIKRDLEIRDKELEITLKNSEIRMKSLEIIRLKKEK